MESFCNNKTPSTNKNIRNTETKQKLNHHVLKFDTSGKGLLKLLVMDKFLDGFVVRACF